MSKKDNRALTAKITYNPQNPNKLKVYFYDLSHSAVQPIKILGMRQNELDSLVNTVVFGSEV